MGKVLIIDDSDPSITYTGNWTTTGTLGPRTGEYNSTVHQSNTVVDRLSYTFEGTNITVYGTLDWSGINDSPSSTFSIDGQTPTGFNFPAIYYLHPNATWSHVAMYTSGNLTKGTHTLTISSNNPPNPSIHLYVDFLEVDTGSDSGSGNIIVHSRDSSIIYVGNWQHYWDFSANPSDVAGGTAMLRFNGTSITIYGTIGLAEENTTASIMFAVDGGTSTQFDSAQSDYGTLFHVAGLSNIQEHSIIVTSLNTNNWLLDYMVYTTQNSSIAGGGGGSSVTGSETGGTGGPNVGAVAGGVAAGLVALLVIAGIIFIHQRRRKRKLNEEPKDTRATVGTGSHSDPSLEPPPFTPPAGDKVGQVLLDSSASTPYQGTQSPQSSPPLRMSQYSDGESQQALTPAVAGPRYGHQSVSDPPHPRFDCGVGEGSTSIYQRDSRQDDDQSSGQPSGYKAQYIVPTKPAVNTHRPPPSGVATIEEDSRIRIPTTAPPVYTPD